MPKRTFNASASTQDLLSQVGNASEYLSRLVERRWAVWGAALRYLTGTLGLPPEVILAACDGLNGTWLMDPLGRSGTALAVELYDKERLSGLCEKRGADPEQWARLERVLLDEGANSGPCSQALLAVVEEFWLGNQACERALMRDCA